ncbi:MAG: alpha/beta hydrolase [Dehalococcoidia bacterium]
MAKLNRGGVALAYDEAGAGDPLMLFVHGWCCDRSHFAPQMAHFSPRHRCVAVDLRGHGDSDKPESAYTFDVFADDLAWLCGELKLTKPVVVGHSMGGAIALALAARHPQLASAIVMLDAPVIFPPAAASDVGPFLEALRTPACHDVLREFFSQRLFIPTDDATRKARILDGAARMRQHVIVACFEAILGFDSDASARACRVPALYVVADPPLAELLRFREACPQLMTAQTAGSGHFHQLEVPDQINAMIERFLALSLAPA